MTWVKLDDDFPEHPKVDRLSDGAFRLHVAGLCHCSRHLTDGFVGHDRVSRLVPRYKPTQVVELVDAGLWEETEGGWQIHDYLLYQPSAEKVKAERAAAAKRMRRHRSPERSGERTGERTAHVREKFADPVPVPVLNKSSSSLKVVGAEGAEEETATPRRPDPDAMQDAASFHAANVLAIQPAGSVRHPVRWRVAAATAWLDEHRAKCLRLLAEEPDLDGAGLLALIQRPTTNPGYRVAAPVEHPVIDDEEKARSVEARAAARRAAKPHRAEEAS